MKYPFIESTETLAKHNLGVFIFDPEDGNRPIFKIASILPGNFVEFTKEEMKRFYPSSPKNKCEAKKAGGLARAAKLSKERRSEIAIKAAKTRWKHEMP